MAVGGGRQLRLYIVIYSVQNKNLAVSKGGGLAGFYCTNYCSFRYEQIETRSRNLQKVFIYSCLYYPQTFKPKKRFESGTLKYNLHKQANASLNSGIDLKEVVKLPPGEDVNDWVAVHGKFSLNFVVFLDYLWTIYTGSVTFFSSKNKKLSLHKILEQFR